MSRSNQAPSTPDVGASIATVPTHNTVPQSSIMSLARTAFRAAPLLITLLGPAAASEGCANVNVDGNITCDPTPSCGNIDVGIDSNPPVANTQFFLASHRWERQNPVTGEVVKVCDPTDRKFCTDNQVPETDHCNPPVCENAKACDPIPSIKNKNEPPRSRDQAGLPKYPVDSKFMISIKAKKGEYPVIFDNVSNCEAGEEPISGATDLPCDPIAQCDQEGKPMIPYCDPLPRCEIGQSPISCTSEEKYLFDSKEPCQTKFADFGLFFSKYDIDIHPAIQPNLFCQPEVNPITGEIFYTLPQMQIQCLPTPECKPGESPVYGTINSQISCDSVQWNSTVNGVASCDPIKSCVN